MANSYREAYKQAMADIRKDLKKEGKSCITTSLKQLKLRSLYDTEEGMELMEQG